MDKKDVDLFIRARKLEKKNKHIILFFTLGFITYWGLKLFGVATPISTDVAITLCVAFIASYLFMKHSNNKNIVTHGQLLDVIERTIQNDAEALKYLSQKQSENSVELDK